MAEDYDSLLAAIDTAEEDAYGSDGDGALSNDRADAIDAYLGKNRIQAPDGRSQVVDRTVYETVQWIMPSLTSIFANGDDVVELPPVGPEDEEGAKQEAAYLNYLVLQKNNWYQIFTTAAKDALLTKAGYMYAYKDKSRQIEVEKYERQTQQGVALIMEDKPEVISINEYPDEDAKPQPMAGPDGQPMIGPDGQPMMQPPQMLYDIEIRRVKEDTKYCIKVLPPERCKVSKNCTGVQVNDTDYFEYFDDITISELRAMGFKIDDDIPDDHNPETQEEIARDVYSQPGGEDDKPVDPAMRNVRCRWIWIKYDQDQDGISELQYVIRVGKEILYREEVSSIPVGVLCPDPIPHRHLGLSIADTTTDIQDIKTVIMRQGLDNLYLTNNQRTFAVPGKVNIDDLIYNRPGGIVRGAPGAVYGQDIAPMQVPFVFPQAVEGMGFMEQVTEGRTGVNRYFQGTDQNSLNKTASGVQQLSTMAAQRVQQIARSFANGVETLFSALHTIVLKGGHSADVVKLRGKWVEVDPSTWRKRTDFRISVGYASGNKDAQVNKLMLIAQMQEKAAMGGLPIVTPENIYETAIELTKASDFAAPQRFWTDPKNTPPPPPPQPDVTIMAAEQIKADVSLKTKQMDVEQKERDSQRDFELGKYKIETDAKLTAASVLAQGEHAIGLESHKAGIARQNQETNAVLEKQKEDATHNAVQVMLQSQQQQTQMLKQALEMIAQVMATATAPKRIVRDANGKVSHTEPMLQ